MIIPMINTRAEAEEQVRLQKFPPLGQRSYGINRAHGYGFDFNLISTPGTIVEF